MKLFVKLVFAIAIVGGRATGMTLDQHTIKSTTSDSLGILPSDNPSPELPLKRREFTLVASPTHFSVIPTPSSETYTSYATPSPITIYLPTPHVNMDESVKLGVGIGIPVGIFTMAFLYLFVRWQDQRKDYLREQNAEVERPRPGEGLRTISDILRDQQSNPPLFTNPNPFGQSAGGITRPSQALMGHGDCQSQECESQHSHGTTLRGGSFQDRKPSSAGRKVSWAL